ncbi:MAG TPA: HEAT repeat domain-containing protein, partial [Polyangiaceae bacterium LLY-WYZ-15_(1-7)]|nr:HEAT repeat domain-containing protein [Polyangiaceae bacterium LLY-WYZ-15_(1-7)]
MSSRFEPRIERLLDALQAGLGGGPADAVRGELGLGSDADDRHVARSLVQIVAAVSVADAGRRPVEVAVEVDAGEEDGAPSADSSLLGRLEGRGSDAIAVDQVDDLQTLLAVLRGGSLRQRRAVLQHLVENLGDRPGREQKQIIETCEAIRDVELEQDLARARESLGGARGRAARADRETWKRRVDRLEQAIDDFWDAQRSVEPVGDLPGDERAQILQRTRDLPPLVIGHLAAVLEGVDGVSSRGARRELLESLRHAGDPRLVPSLTSLLDSGSPEIVTEAARALRRIEDPRIRPSVERAYERSVVDSTRAVLAAALGSWGDRRGLDYVRQLLQRDDPEVQLAALEALETLGGAEDTEAVAALLEEGGALTLGAVQTLARVGDARALRPLAELEASTRVSAVRAAAEEARLAIVARMELRGEELDESLEETTQAIRLAHEERPETPTGARFKAFRSYLFGQLLLAFGVVKAGIARLEQAATLRPGWARPWVAIALNHARRRKHAAALAAFRRAIETDRSMVERNPITIRSLAQTFLRRAEQVERDGRHDIARGLLGEVLDLDLRRA